MIIPVKDKRENNKMVVEIFQHNPIANAAV